MRDVLATIKSQILATKVLKTYPPVDWTQRCVSTAEDLVPWLQANAPDMKSYVEDVLNSPKNLREVWSELQTICTIPPNYVENVNRQLTLNELLRISITGEIVSIVVSHFLTESYPSKALASNGKSDYPDLYLSNRDYSFLPKFSRQMLEYGAALKGKTHRPVRIPDGLEIKTAKTRVAIDCHHPHVGLHLVQLFHKKNDWFEVADFLVAFLEPSDYRESKRNTTATTVKYSFNESKFVSILSTNS